jgi:hypothetical protein
VFSYDGEEVLYGGDNGRLMWHKLERPGESGEVICPTSVSRIVPDPREARVAVLAGRTVLLVKREGLRWVEQSRVTISEDVTALAFSNSGEFLFVGTGTGKGSISTIP